MTYILTHTFLDRAWKWLPLFMLLVTVAVFSSGRVLAADPSSNVSVFATGLDNPRGLKFGPNGDLYVAEGGTGGSDSTVGQCDQVVEPVGPYTGSKTGARISKISPDGTRTTVVDKLPSSQTSPKLGSEISGVGDVASGLMLPTAMTFGPDGQLYVSNCGFGCPPGQGNIVRVDVTNAAPAALPVTGGVLAGSRIWWWLIALGLVLVAGGLLVWRQKRRGVPAGFWLKSRMWN